MGILYPLGFEEQKNPALKDGIRHKIQNLRSLKQKTDATQVAAPLILKTLNDSPYINTTRATDPDAEEMTIQLMGLIITFGEILAETVEYVIADETGTQSV